MKKIALLALVASSTLSLTGCASLLSLLPIPIPGLGASNGPAMRGESRVTVIATGFDRTREEPKRADIITFPAKRREERHVSPVVHSPIAPTATTPTPVSPAAPLRPAKPAPVADVPDMEIPTFIRRQMD